MSSRGLQLEASTVKADNARLAQDVAQAQSTLAALKATLEASQHDAQQVERLGHAVNQKWCWASAAERASGC